MGLQIEYSLLERTVERELIPMAIDQQLTVLAWSPLRNGLLSGKYMPENSAASEKEGARMHSPMMKAFGSIDEAAQTVVRETMAVGKELGVSAAQVALAWLRTRPAAVIPIIGARKMSQFQDNLASLAVTFSPDQLARLDRVSAVPKGFPHDFLALESVKGIVFGGLRDRIKV